MKPNIKTFLTIAAPVLLTGVLIGWLLFGGASDSGVTAQKHDAGETVWTCSMHPQIRQSEPGQCPICGMDLIPLSNEKDETSPMAILMSPAALKLADIRTATVGKMAAVKTIRLNGKVEADERLLFTQSSHIPGRIEKLMINFTGEFVSAGQVIAYVYSPELVTAQKELFEARNIKDSQPQLFDAAMEKLRNWKLGAGQIENILESGTLMESFPIQADRSGYVTMKMVNQGDYIQRGQGLYRIADLSKVWILFDVYESEMAWLKKGDKISYTVSSLPGDTFEGVITYIDPVIDPRTRVAKARVEAVNTDQRLKPEMFTSGTVEAKLSQKSDPVLIPKTAVMWTGKRSIVYVKNLSASSVSFMLRNVTLGPALGDHYIVEEGLREGEEIAVNGAFSIDAAAQLSGKPSMMNPVGGVTMTGHNHGGSPAGGNAPGPKNRDKAVLSPEAKEALEPLFAAYYNLKDALVRDEFSQATEAATTLKAVLNGIGMNLFTGDSHSIWMESQSGLNDHLEHIQHLETIEDLRRSFQGISEGMIRLAEGFGPPDGEVNVQHCPMADNNKGADWLSKEKEIRNPYFGSSMLTCGEVTKTIK